MFIRENKNRSESVSIQIINKSRGRYKVVKTIGCATHLHEIEHLKNLALQEIERLQSQPKLFKSEQDDLIEDVISSLSNSSISTVGPELIFGCKFRSYPPSDSGDPPPLFVRYDFKERAAKVLFFSKTFPF